MLRLVGVLLCSLCIGAGEAVAQQAAGRGAARPLFVDLSQRGGGAGDAQALLAKAGSAGIIRVIIGLAVAHVPPDTLSPEARTAQAGTLRAAQDRVTTRALGRAPLHAHEVKRFETIPYVSLAVDAGAMRRLLADPEVTNIQEDVAIPPALLESIPRVNADDVWADGIRGAGWTIAVLDTGVDKTHPMLAGRVVSEACYSTDDPDTRVVSLCPGRVAESTEPGSGMHCINVIGCDHGTHVAGIAAGRGTSSVPLNGVATSARIVAMQIFSRFNRARDCFVGPPCVATFYTDLIKGLERVYALRDEHRIAAVNLSLGGGFFYGFPCDNVQPAMTAIIQLLRSARIATVIASGNAGNTGAMTPPACISAAISVGSTLDSEDTVSNFSNHASQTRLMAPGSNITSSVPGGTTAEKNGTSMATPHVAGAFALLRDVYPRASVDDVAAALECTGVPVSRGDIIKPRIDIEAAHSFLLEPPNTPRHFTFDRPKDKRAWTPLLGTFKSDAGLYRSDHRPYWKISSIANCNENLTIEARLRRVDVDPVTSWNTGIFFKAQLNPEAKRFSGYYAAYNKLDGGQVFLTRLHNYDLNVQNGGWAHVLCLEWRPINLSGFNTIRVVSAAGRHRVFFNGEQYCDVQDQTYGVGSIAVASYFPDPARDHAFEIDEVHIVPREVVPGGASSAALPTRSGGSAKATLTGVAQSLKP